MRSLRVARISFSSAAATAYARLGTIPVAMNDCAISPLLKGNPCLASEISIGRRSASSSGTAPRLPSRHGEIPEDRGGLVQVVPGDGARDVVQKDGRDAHGLARLGDDVDRRRLEFGEQDVEG